VNDDQLRERIRRALDAVHRPDPGLVRRSAEAAVRGRRGRRLVAALTAVTVTAVALAAVAVALVRHEMERQTGPAVPTPSAVSAGPVVYTLTAANQVVAVDRRTLRVRWTRQVAPPPSSSVSAGAMLGISADGSRLYVLPAESNGGGTSVHVLDAASGRPGAVIALAAAGGPLYRTFAVHPRSGDLYVVGQDSGHVLVSVVDPVRQVVLSTSVTRTLPSPSTLGNRPYQAAFTADGTRLYYSYGFSAAVSRGIDWADVRGPGVSPCRAASPGAACIPSSPGQGFVIDGSHLLFADDSVPVQLVETTLNGTVVHRSSTGLSANVRDVVLTSGRNQVAILASCDSLGGLNTVDRSTGRHAVVVTPAPAGSEPSSSTLCGLRPALLSDGTLAISQVTQGTPTPELPGTLVFASSTTGRLIGSVTLPAQAVDVLADG